MRCFTWSSPHALVEVSSHRSSRRHVTKSCCPSRSLSRTSWEPACLRHRRHPRPADIDALAAFVRRQSQEGECQRQSLPAPPTYPRTDRQACAHAPLARVQVQPKRHGRFVGPARAPVSQCLLGRRALIIFAKDKELTAKESMHALSLMCGFLPGAPVPAAKPRPVR